MAIIPFRFMRDMDAGTRDFRPHSDFQREMNKVIDSFFTDWSLIPSAGSTTTAGALTPSVDIAEAPKEFMVHAELPGLEEKDIELSFNKGVLTIKGEKRFEQEHKDKNYIRTERSYGSFSRSIPFATEIDENKIEADFKNGVLNIKLPKAASAVKEAKKISIKSS